MRAALILLILSGCSAIPDLEGTAIQRAKQPIIVTFYHGHF